MKPLRNLCQRTVLIPLLLLAAMAWHGESIAAQLSSTWTDNSNNEDGFKIERKQGQTGTFAQFATVGVNINSYTDSSLADYDAESSRLVASRTLAFLARPDSRT